MKLRETLIGIIALFFIISCTPAETPPEETPPEDSPPEEIPPDIDERKSCNTADDCVAASCCHPDEVVNNEYAPECDGVACTTVCAGPLDCGCGEIVCEDSQCGIRKISDESYCQ